MTNTYTLGRHVALFSHYQTPERTLHDHARPHNFELDAHVRSGDYFITLATTLEALAEDVGEMNTSAMSLALARLAKELDYVQRHYKIVRKDHPDPLTELS